MLIKPDVQRFAKIKILGLGGGGGNALASMINLQQIHGVEFIAINTDAQALMNNPSPTKVQIGEALTRGLGSGGNPDIGRQAAEESTEKIEEVLKDADMVFLTAGMGGGCLRASSQVFSNPHGPVRIDSIKPGSFVYSLEEGKLARKKVLAAMRTGIKNIYEVKTKNNTLYASYDHPFLKVNPLNPDKKGRFSKFDLIWIEAEDLKKGDLVVILRKASEIEEAFQVDMPYLSKEFCRLFGFLLGDGWISRSEDSFKIHFSPSPDSIKNQRYIKLLKEFFNLDMKKSAGANWYYANSKKSYDILESLGFYKKAQDKEIPEWVFGLPNDFKKEFILGLADADGSYLRQYKKNKKEKFELRFEMHSQRLIEQLKVLCNYLGLRTSNVLSRTRKIKTPNSKEELLVTSWGVRVYKLYQLDEALEEKTRERKGLGFLYGYRGPTNSEFFENFGFGKITSVKEIGEEDVYDITVEGSHNFVSEGFVIHNTGTGAIPIAATISKKLGALTVAVVTKPFNFEGSRRMIAAEEGLEELKDKVDALIIIPNQRLIEVVDPKMSLKDSFKMADSVLGQGVQGISDLIIMPGLINVDFADVKSIMTSAGSALMGIGEAGGEGRAEIAAKMAIASPLLEVSIDGAKGVLFNIVAGSDLTMDEVDKAAKIISSAADPDANIIFGATIREDQKDLKISVIATGFDQTRARLREFAGASISNGLNQTTTTVYPGLAPLRSISKNQMEEEEEVKEPIMEEEEKEDLTRLDIPAFLRHGR